MGIDPSTTCIGIAVVSSKDELVLHGYIPRPKGKSKMAHTEAMEVMYGEFRREFHAIDAGILEKVLSVSIEYPYMRTGPRCDPQATIKLAMFAGMVSSVVRERFRELGFAIPEIVYALYSEVKESL